MSHWAVAYAGKRWSPQQDCFYWFRYWSREHFGIELVGADIDHRRLTYTAARVLTGDVRATFGYERTETPKEGDAVFMTQRQQPHHVGMMVWIDNKLQVLHALEGAGVVLSDMLDLATNGWTIKGYWTYAG